MQGTVLSGGSTEGGGAQLSPTRHTLSPQLIIVVCHNNKPNAANGW